MNSAKPVSRRRQGGFTLIELLVVTVILLIVMGAVMGTISTVTRSSFTGNQVTDAQQNLRSGAKAITDDIVPLGSSFMGQVGGDSVFVRRGFLASMNFPTQDMQSGTGGLWDEVFAIQGANNIGANPGPATQPTYGATNVNAATGAAENPTTAFRIYSGNCPSDRVADLYKKGTDQLLIVKPDPVILRFRDNYLNPADADTIPDLVQVDEGLFTAYANYQGSNLRLIAPPVNLGGSVGTVNSNMGTQTQFLSDPASATGGRLMAAFLTPYQDCVVINVAGGARFLGLVTRVNMTTGEIFLDFGGASPNAMPTGLTDPIGLNPDWSQARIPVGGSGDNLDPFRLSRDAGTGPSFDALGLVNVRRAKLLRYYVAAPDGTQPGQPTTACALYRREGAIVTPVSFDVENMQVSYTLIDDPVGGNGALHLMSPLPSQTPCASPCQVLTDFNTLPPQPPGVTGPGDTGYRTRRWNRGAVRAVRIQLFARSSDRDRVLIGKDPTTMDFIDRGYYHVLQEFTVSLRNASYNR